MAIANNTVSIIIAGPIAKTINDEYHLDNKNTASILDIFVCIFQGLLPYGAQVLMILSFSKGKIDYLDLVSNTWYLLLLFVYSLLVLSPQKELNIKQKMNYQFPINCNKVRNEVHGLINWQYLG